MRAIAAVVAGLLAAFAIMIACEFTNSRLFPFPPGMDPADIEQVRAFAAKLPLRALVLVALGWVLGSLAAGWVATRFSKSGSPTVALAAGGVLTLGALFNAWLIRNPWWFHFGGLPLFLLLTWAGHRLARAR